MPKRIFRKESEDTTMKKTISKTQLILTVLSVCSLLISNVLSAKQFLLPFGITMTGAVIVFPITYILSDLFSEVYGYKWSRFTCYLGFAMNVFMVLAFQAAIATPAPDYWMNQEAFQTVLGSTPRILAASLLAFVVGDFVNDRVFRRMKAKYEGMNGFAGRAILSSFCGEVVDSAIFIPLAFIGQMPVEALLAMAVTQVCLKVGYEIVIVPVTAAITKKVKAMESQATAG